MLPLHRRLPPIATMTFFVVASLYIDRRLLSDIHFDDPEAPVPVHGNPSCDDSYQSILRTVVQQHPETVLQLLLDEDDIDDADLGPLATAIANVEGHPFAEMDWKGGPAPICRDERQERCNCGIYKCFFRAVNPTRGYLVARHVHQTFKHMASAYELERRLVEDFGVSTRIALEPPILLQDTSAAMIQVLRRYGSKYKNEKGLIVQEVLKIPEPHLYIGSAGSKSRKTKQLLPVFAGKLTARGVDLAAFANRFQTEIETCIKVLEEKQGLRHDFQVILGTSGELFYIDLDRHFEIEHKNRTRPLMSIGRIRHGLERILYWVTVGGSMHGFVGLEEDDFWFRGDAVA
jgi:hypothetical protein